MTKIEVPAVFDELKLAGEIVEEDGLMMLLEAEILEIEKTETELEEPAKLNKGSSRWAEDFSGKLICRWVFED